MPRKSFRSATLNTPTTSAAPKHDAVPQIPSTFTDGLPLPKLFVFDLDYTLWPFWVDTHVSGSLKPTNKDPSALNTAMTDGYGETFTFYKEVPGILHAARQKGITMGLASRTSAPDLAGVMLRGIVIPTPTTSSSTTTDETSEPDKSAQSGKEKETPLKAWDYFAYKEIYPGSKIRHFESIQNKTRKYWEGGELAFADMLFFDDESRNREVETKLGVTFVLVRDGVTKAEVDRGVWDWRRRRGLDKGAGQENGGEESE